METSPNSSIDTFISNKCTFNNQHASHHAQKAQYVSMGFGYCSVHVNLKIHYINVSLNIRFQLFSVVVVILKFV